MTDLKPNVSIITFLPVVFYKNVLIFSDLVIFSKNVLSYFMKSYENVSTLKYAYINVFQFKILYVKQANLAQIDICIK